jgi:succinate-semialdehyde dehydrogenase/glutarate-semialdehyde dehydrogenase
MLTRKAGLALAAGRAMVVKPDTQTPLSALAERSGLPKGLLSLEPGGNTLFVVFNDADAAR